MKTFAVDENYDFVFKNGDIFFIYDNNAILSVATQKAETIRGEIPNYEDVGILEFKGMSSLADSLKAIVRLSLEIQEIDGVNSVLIKRARIKKYSLIYEMEINTIYEYNPINLTNEHYYGK